MKIFSLKYDDVFREVMAYEGIRKQLISDVAGILDAIEVVRRMNLGKKLRWTYEARLKAKRDRKAEDDYVRDEGRAEGRAEGRIEGQMEGLVQGRAEGQEQLAQLIVRMSENGEAGQLERLSDAKFRNEMLQKYGLS